MELEPITTRLFLLQLVEIETNVKLYLGNYGAEKTHQFGELESI